MLSVTVAGSAVAGCRQKFTARLHKLHAVHGKCLDMSPASSRQKLTEADQSWLSGKIAGFLGHESAGAPSQELKTF